MSREDLTLPPDLDPDTVTRSRKRQQDNVYALPAYVEAFIAATAQALPAGWRCLPWTINRCATIRNSRNEVQFTVTYEAIEDGYTFAMEDLLT